MITDLLSKNRHNNKGPCQCMTWMSGHSQSNNPATGTLAPVLGHSPLERRSYCIPLKNKHKLQPIDRGPRKILLVLGWVADPHCKNYSSSVTGARFQPGAISGEPGPKSMAAVSPSAAGDAKTGAMICLACAFCGQFFAKYPSWLQV